MSSPDEHDQLAALQLQVCQLARQLEMVAGAVDEMETVLHDLPTVTAAAGLAPTDDQPTEPAPFDFATLYAWVHIHVATITERKISKSSESGIGVRWCTQWYEHDEAIARLEALRRTWEEHVAQPGAAMSNWYIHHYDPHLGALTPPRRPVLAMQPRTPPTCPPGRTRAAGGLLHHRGSTTPPQAL